MLPTLWHNNHDHSCDDHMFIQCDLTKMMKKAYLQFVFLPWFFILAVVIAGLNLPIFQAVWAQLKLQHGRNPVTSTPLGRNRQQSNIKSSDIRMVKTVLLIYGTFFACWLPCILVLAIEVYGDVSLANIRGFMYVPTMINSVLNPVIYGFRMQVFRKELLRRFPFCEHLFQRRMSQYGVSSPVGQVNSRSSPSSTLTITSSSSPSSVSSIPILLSPVKRIESLTNIFNSES